MRFEPQRENGKKVHKESYLLIYLTVYSITLWFKFLFSVRCQKAFR